MKATGRSERSRCFAEFREEPVSETFNGKRTGRIVSGCHGQPDLGVLPKMVLRHDVSPGWLVAKNTRPVRSRLGAEAGPQEYEMSLPVEGASPVVVKLPELMGGTFRG